MAPVTRRLAVLALALAACAAPAYGNACTAAATGNWSANATWASCGGTHPGATDTVAIAAGATITCDIAVCTSAAMSATSPGTFIIATGSTWEPTANATLGTSADKYYLTFQAGSGLNCMPAVSTNVVIGVGYAYQYPSVWTISGTSGSHVTLTTTPASGATCSFVQGQTSGLSINWQYADFSYFANASSQMIPALGLGGGGAGDVLALNYVTCNYCGSITMSGDNLDPAGTLSIQNSTWTNTVGGLTIYTTTYNAATTGARVVSGNSFDTLAKFTYPGGLTVTGNTFLNKFDFYSGVPSTFQANFAQTLDGANLSGPSGGMNANGTLTGNYFYINSAGMQDSHYIQVEDGLTVTLSNNILEAGNASTQSSNEGSFVTADNASSTIYLTGNLILPDASGVYSSARVTGLLGGSATRIYATHNTYFAGGRGIQIGECLSGTCSPYDWAGMIQSVQYNNVWGSGSGVGFISQNITATTPTTDAMASGAANYNNGYLLGTGTCNNGSGFSCAGYQNFVFSSGTPGTHDTHVNPQFVDSARNLKKWDTSVGGPGTEADALARLAANPALTASSLMPYVTAGFAPQNAAVCNMDGMGNYAGAVPCVLSSVGSIVCLGLCALIHVP